MRPFVMAKYIFNAAVEPFHPPSGNVQTHPHTTNHFHSNNEFDICNHLKPLNIKKCKVYPGDQHRVPEPVKLLSSRKMKPVNRSNPSLADDFTTPTLGRSSSPLRRSAPLLDVSMSRRASSPLLGALGDFYACRNGRGAVLLPIRAPSLPLASKWCCGSFVKQLRKTHHFD